MKKRVNGLELGDSGDGDFLLGLMIHIGTTLESLAGFHHGWGWNGIIHNYLCDTKLCKLLGIHGGVFCKGYSN